MAEPKNNITITADEILRYLRGAMPAADMHRIERMALEDPLLDDAIEGYRLALQEHEKQALEAGIANVNRVPGQKTKEGAIIPLWRRPLFQYAVAASVVLVFGAWLFNLSTRQQAADKSAAFENVENSANPVLRADSAPAAAKQTEDVAATPQLPRLEAPQMAPAAPAKQPQEVKSMPEQPAPLRQQDDATKDNTYDTRSVAAAAAPLPTDTEVKAARELPAKQLVENGYRGVVLNEQGEPLPGAVVKLQGTGKGVVADNKGSFVLPTTKTDSVAMVAVSHLGYNTRNFKLRPNQESTLQLEVSGNDLSEVVVSGYAARKSRDMMTNAPENPTDTSEAVPLVSWKAYEQYLGSARGNSKAAPVYVTLAFEVDATGKIDNVVAIESGGRKRNQQAEKMLREGPAWRNKTGKTADAKVTFVF